MRTKQITLQREDGEQPREADPNRGSVSATFVCGGGNLACFQGERAEYVFAVSTKLAAKGVHHWPEQSREEDEGINATLWEKKTTSKTALIKAALMMVYVTVSDDVHHLKGRLQVVWMQTENNAYRVMWGALSSIAFLIITIPMTASVQKRGLM